LAGEHIINLIAFALSLGGRRAYDYIAHGLIIRQFVTTTDTALKVKIHSPDYAERDLMELETVNLVFTAYKKAKEDQKNKSSIYAPSSLWKDQIDNAYAPLLQGFNKNNIEQFHFFLCNFGSWKTSTGIESSSTVQSHAVNNKTIHYFEDKMMRPFVQWWINYESRGWSLESMAHPMFGNQYGAFINGHFVTIGSIFSDLYSQLIAGFMQAPRPIIAELGGGYGKLFYFLRRKISNFCYLDFDLPESLACASYYLLKSFPDKKFLLYGEGPLSKDSLQEYDFILPPYFELPKLPKDSVDIFVNTTSLGEMEPDSAKYFLGEISRTAKCFFHANHEFVRNNFEGGSVSLIKTRISYTP
jgi:putative sugar O-methyltransferase